jgi:uridine phosphorylase
MKRQYPILEYDREPNAVIEPSKLYQPIDIAEHCVMCFFLEVIERVRDEKKARVVFEEKWEDGTHRIYEFLHGGRRVAFCHPGIGGPLAASVLETAIGNGCRKFIVCGGAGVLDKEVAVGHLIVPGSAVRDEGTSYHYLPPSREVAADRDGMAAIEETLKAHNISYLTAKTWSTDGVFRETPEKVSLRRAEGCLTVEMEAASLFAVARFRKVPLGYILYGGDDVSGDVWDTRDWLSRKSVRERMFWLAVEACLKL